MFFSFKPGFENSFKSRLTVTMIKVDAEISHNYDVCERILDGEGIF